MTNHREKVRLRISGWQAFSRVVHPCLSSCPEQVSGPLCAYLGATTLEEALFTGIGFGLVPDFNPPLPAADDIDVKIRLERVTVNNDFIAVFRRADLGDRFGQDILSASRGGFGHSDGANHFGPPRQAC